MIKGSKLNLAMVNFRKSINSRNAIVVDAYYMSGRIFPDGRLYVWEDRFNYDNELVWC